MNGEKSKICKEYLLKYPTLSYPDIARNIIRDQKLVSDGKSVQAWRVLAMKVARKEGIKREVIIAAQEEEKYIVVDDHYSWKASRGLIKMSVAFIDQLFYEYSNKGLNLSQTEIINKHNLKVWEWTSIKNTLWLFKQSNIFSPHTVENTPKEELSAMIEDKMNKLFSNVGYQAEQQYKKALDTKFRSVINAESQRDNEVQSLILELSDLLPKCGVTVTKARSHSLKKEIINVFIFDLHFGIENELEGLSTTLPQYDIQTTKGRLKEIAKEVNLIGASKVNIFFGGDIIETFTGLNHPDSWKGIAKGYWGSKVVMEAYKAIVEFVGMVYNVDKIYSVPGNHDRSTESSKVDREGYINQIIFELVKLSYQDKIEVIQDSRLISVAIDSINYLVSHGNFKISDMNPADMILEYGEPKLFNILISGHFHERKIKKDTKNFRQLVCPEVGGLNDYSVRNGYLSQPGFLVVNNNGKGKPFVRDYSL